MRPSTLTTAAVLASLAGAAVSCSVQIASGPGLACDTDHPCSDERRCTCGVCIDAGDPADRGSRCSRTQPCSAHYVCFGGLCLEPSEVPGDGGRCAPRRLACQLEAAPGLSFEDDAPLWTAYQGGDPSRVDGGVDGEFALEVRHAGDSTWGVQSAKAGWFVGTTARGTLYCFEAWVRTVSADAGTIRLRLNERPSPDTTEGPNVDLNFTVGGEWARIAGERALSWPMVSTPHWQVFSEDVETFDLDAVSLKVAAP